MICPNCGYKIKDDLLYCENCGYEIQFVPDFEPEIEQSISDTLSEIHIQDFSEENNFSNSNSDAAYSDEAYSREEYFDGKDYSADFNDEEYSDLNYSDSEYINNEFSDAEFQDEDYSNGEYSDTIDSNLEDSSSEPESYFAGENQSNGFQNNDYKDNDSFDNDYSSVEYYDDYNKDYYDDYGDDEDYDDCGDDEDYDDCGDDEDYDDNEEDDFLGDPFDDFEYEAHLLKKFINFIKYSKLKWLIFFSLIFIIAVAIFASVKISNKIYLNNSVDHQVQLAAEAASNNDYASAIEYMEKALSLNSSDSSKKYLLAEYYFNNDEDEKAILMLWEIINENSDNSLAAYKKMIDYYIANENYTIIEEILSNCNNNAVKDQYESYLALAPEYSIAEGTYEDEISVELLSDVTGIIYYTLDGSEPTTESNVYYEPIVLSELGIYTISALYVNQYGIESDIVKKTYTIDISTPKAPNVILEAGSYSLPLMIEVDVPKYCNVYYTTDGTMPTIFSNEYSCPIPMPIGDSHFIFVAINQESVWSEVTEVDYKLNLTSKVDINSITQNLLNYDYLLGKTVDLEGNMLGNTTHYSYLVSSAVSLNHNDNSMVYLKSEQESDEEISTEEKLSMLDMNNIDIYYLITETMADNQNNVMKTGTIYLCNTKDGKLYNASRNDDGSISLLDEITEDKYTIATVEIFTNDGLTIQ